MGNRPAEKLTFAQKHLALMIYNINNINEKGEHISIINRLHPLQIFVICIPLNGVNSTANLWLSGLKKVGMGDRSPIPTF